MEDGSQCLHLALTFGELTLNVLYLKDIDSRRLKSLYCLLLRQWAGAREHHIGQRYSGIGCLGATQRAKQATAGGGRGCPSTDTV